MEAALKFEPELMGVDSIDAAVHEPEAVCRADDCVGDNVDLHVVWQRPGQRREDVPVAHGHPWNSRELFLPCGYQRGVQVAEVYLERGH